MLDRALIILLPFLFCSCATVETHVTRFHRLPPKGTGQTFAVVPPRASAALESRAYAAQIAAGFERYGWRLSTSSKPDYRVTFEYAISGGRDVQGSVPIFGQTGGGTTFHQGTFNSSSPYGGYSSGSVSGTSYTPATFGVVGTRSINQTIYERLLLVNATDRTGSSVLEARCKSTGGSPDISSVLPAMIDSLFTGFPGVSGKAKLHSKPPGS